MSGVKPSGPSRAAIGALILSLCALIAASVVMFRSPVRTSKHVRDGVSPDAPSDAEPTKEGYVHVGGVQRPETDLKARLESGFATETLPWDDYGSSQPVDPETNEHTRSIAEAFRTGKFAERLTTAIASRPFGQKLYNSDPQQYLGVVEPGRVFQPAQPGPGVSRLKYATDAMGSIVQGETVPLRVKALPDAPVTFTSFDLGEFQNRLNTITVKADDKGHATAIFRGSPGTIGPVDILAASPVTSGQLRFTVHVVQQKPAP